MSKVCSLCGKRPVSGNNVSHSKRRTKRRFNPNLVTKRFSGVKVQICTSCLRTLKKPERVARIKDKGLSGKTEEVEVKAEKVEKKKAEKKSSSKK